MTVKEPITRSRGWAALLARILPLGAVLAYVIAIRVPVMQSHGGIQPDLIVTTLGLDYSVGDPIDPLVVVLWNLLLGCAVTAWPLSRLRAWGVVAIASGVLLLTVLLTLLADPPFYLWDGIDDEGRPTGGLVEAEPASGAALWAASGLLLIAAGVHGLLSGPRRRDRTERPEPPPSDP